MTFFGTAACISLVAVLSCSSLTNSLRIHFPKLLFRDVRLLLPFFRFDSIIPNQHPYKGPYSMEPSVEESRREPGRLGHSNPENRTSQRNGYFQPNDYYSNKPNAEPKEKLYGIDQRPQESHETTAAGVRKQREREAELELLRRQESEQRKGNRKGQAFVMDGKLPPIRQRHQQEPPIPVYPKKPKQREAYHRVHSLSSEQPPKDAMGADPVPHHHHVITKIVRSRQQSPQELLRPHHHHVVTKVVKKPTVHSVQGDFVPMQAGYYRLPPPRSF